MPNTKAIIATIAKRLFRNSVTSINAARSRSCVMIIRAPLTIPVANSMTM